MKKEDRRAIFAALFLKNFFCWGEKPSLFNIKLKLLPMKPRAPISKIKSWTDQPLSWRSVLREAYLTCFFRAACTMLRSSGTVCSNQRSVLVTTEKTTISGRWLVSTLVRPGIVGLPEKSKLICQSDADLASKMELKTFRQKGLRAPSLINFLVGTEKGTREALRLLVFFTRPKRSLCMEIRTLSCLQV